MMSVKRQHRGGQRVFPSFVLFRRRGVRGLFYSIFALLIMGGVLVGRTTVLPALSVPQSLTADEQIFKIPPHAAVPSGTKPLTPLTSTPPPVVSPFTTAATGNSQALGIAAGSSLPAMSSSTLNATIHGIAMTGAKWLRFDFDWSQVQPNNSQSYNWGPYDAVVAAASANHLNILGIIDYTPAWARGGGCGDSKCGPASTGQYAAFAQALATHYATTVHAWEIWNEPNNPGFWHPSPDPRAYVAILRAAYQAIHNAAANETVLTAGLSPEATTSNSYAPYDFLNAVYQDGGEPYFDAVGDHPYTFPLTPAANADHAWAQMANPSGSLRSLMVAHGDADKKIWVTEFGSPTGGPGPVATLANPNLSTSPYVVDPALQAKILSDAINLYRSYSWTGPFFYYTYQDSGTDPSTNENFFGLQDTHGTPKPAYTVFQQAAANP